MASICHDRFRRELRRLEEEGSKLIEEELEKVNQEVEEWMTRSRAPSGEVEASIKVANKGLFYMLLENQPRVTKNVIKNSPYVIAGSLLIEG